MKLVRWILNPGFSDSSTTLIFNRTSSGLESKASVSQTRIRQFLAYEGIFLT